MKPIPETRELTARQLVPGTSLSVAVDPATFYVPTGILMSPGERYTFAAHGRWRDWNRVCGPEGWRGGWLTRFCRVPGQPFFRLCASLGRDDRAAFAVNLEKPWTVPETAVADQLYLFANDWRVMYFNNHAMPEDPLTVTITRLA